MPENPSFSPSKRQFSFREEVEALKKRSRIDFWAGLAGSIIGNILLYLLLAHQNPNTYPNLPLPWLLNIAALILPLVFGRPSISKGILASYGLALALAFCAGIYELITCGSNL